jgi:alpha-1,3-glucan synthase
MLQLRAKYRKLQDGFGLSHAGSWTHQIQLPGSNGTGTDMGLWSAIRTGVTGQTFTTADPDILFVYMNDNTTQSYTVDCTNKNSAMQAPYISGTTIRNLFYPYENITLAKGTAPFDTGVAGCIPAITMDPYTFKAFVPVAAWVGPSPMITKFEPGHDARLYVEAGDTNQTTIPLALEFNVPMDCGSITKALTFNASSSGHGGPPKLGGGTCKSVTANTTRLGAADPSVFRWEGTLTNVPDGVLTVTLTNASSSDGLTSTGCTDNFLVRKGSAGNPMVNGSAVYNASLFTQSGGNFAFAHNAFGADMFRYSWNFGVNWTDWKAWEDTTSIPASQFQGKDYFWEGQHIIVQCELLWSILLSPLADSVCDRLELRYSGFERRHARRLRLQVRSHSPAVPCSWPIQPVGLRQGSLSGDDAEDRPHVGV